MTILKGHPTFFLRLASPNRQTQFFGIIEKKKKKKKEMERKKKQQGLTFLYLNSFNLKDEHHNNTSRRLGGVSLFL